MRELIHRVNGKIKIPVNLTFPMQGKDYDVPEWAKGMEFHKGGKRLRHDCYGAIYMIFHEGDGRAYIGQTTQPINQRVGATLYSALHKINGLYNTKISEAIRQFGIESFSVWELSRHYSKEELNRAERESIKKFSTNKFAGFNSESGGKSGFTVNARSRMKMSISREGERNGRYGKPVLEETRRKIGLANGGDRSAWKGKKHSLAEKEKIGKSNREYYRLHPERALAISIRRKKKVHCIETGEIFDSLNAAAAKIGATNGGISQVCSGKKLTCKGLHFQYYKQEKQ